MADDTNNLIPQDNEEDNLVELIDENGEHTFFEHRSLRSGSGR